MSSNELGWFIGAFLLVVGGLLPIVNPVGSAPMFLALTHGSDERTRQMLAARVAVNSFILLLSSMVFGTLVLRMFGLSVPVVQLAGGAVLVALGWNLLTSETTTHAGEQPVSDDIVSLRAFYPLTMPLTVDPGAISVAITIGANHAHGVERVAIAIVASLLGIGLIAFTVWLAYRYAERVGKWLGHTGTMVVLRLCAFIVLCIGVQISWNGAKALLSELPLAGAPAAKSSERAR